MPLLSAETRLTQVILAIVFTFFFFVALILFILWLNLRPLHPKFHIQEFSVSGLDQSNGFQNAQVTFVVTVRNANRHIEISYESIDALIYYKEQLIGGAPVLGPVRQGPKNTTILHPVLSGSTLTSSNNQGWKEFVNDSGQGTVDILLVLRTSTQYKKSFWDIKHHHLRANCEVAVGSDGTMLPSYKSRKCPI